MEPPSSALPPLAPPASDLAALQQLDKVKVENTTSQQVAHSHPGPLLVVAPSADGYFSMATDLTSAVLQSSSPTLLSPDTSMMSPDALPPHHIMQSSPSIGGLPSTTQVAASSSSSQEHLLSSSSSSSSTSMLPQSTDANVAAADSNSPKQAFVPCKVCGDKASGYHYGVTSCEGCKGFFRRSIQKQIEYRCLRDGKCLVMRLNRNRCQYCRFKKCLAVGMSRDSVRYGRVPKRSRSTEDQRVSTSGGECSPSSAQASNQQDQAVLESKQLAMYDIILTISQAHHANCLTTEDKVKALSNKATSLISPIDCNVDMLSKEAVDQHRCKMFQNLAGLVTPVINLVVAFAKQVPGFQELSQDDQLILIKGGFFEIWLTRMVRMFNAQDNTVTFGDGSSVPRAELEVIYMPELVQAMFSFARSFSLLRLNDTEIGLFSGVVLATADRAGLADKKTVERIQDRLIEALKLQISRNHALEPNLFASILMKIPELRTLGAKHTDQLDWYRRQWHTLHLPPLFAEIYDVPKLDSEVEPEASGGSGPSPPAVSSPQTHLPMPS